MMAVRRACRERGEWYQVILLHLCSRLALAPTAEGEEHRAHIVDRGFDHVRRTCVRGYCAGTIRRVHPCPERGDYSYVQGRARICQGNMVRRRAVGPYRHGVR